MSIKNFENYKSKNQTEMKDDDDIAFQKLNPSNMTTQYLILPKDTQQKMKNKTSDVSKYWKLSNVGDMIMNNFEFDDNKWYNIYFLQNDGWRMMNKRSKKGVDYLKDKTMNYILDSNAVYMDDSNENIYAVEIEEIGTKNA